MKTDTYTKGVLTVIAVSLVAIVFQNFNVVKTANAGPSGYTPFPTTVMDVNIKSIDTYDMMPVKIKDIDTYDVFNVNLKQVGGSSVSSSSGRLNVKVD